MATYVPILDTQLDPDAPLTSTLMYQLRDNTLAIAEGATGAARIIGSAVARIGNGLPSMTVSASDAVGLGYGAGLELLNIVAGTTELVGFRYTFYLYSGVVRMKCTHARTGGASSATISLYKNGVFVTSFGGSVSPTERIVDLTIAVNDVVEWRHVASAAGGSTISVAAVTANDGYVAISPYIKASLI
jgi:hypothetical protein